MRAARAAARYRPTWARWLGRISSLSSTSPSRSSAGLRPSRAAASSYSRGVTSLAAEKRAGTSTKWGEAVQAKSVTSACSKTWVEVPSGCSRRSTRRPVAPTTKRRGRVISAR